MSWPSLTQVTKRESPAFEDPIAVVEVLFRGLEQDGDRLRAVDVFRTAPGVDRQLVPSRDVDVRALQQNLSRTFFRLEHPKAQKVAIGVGGVRICLQGIGLADAD